MLYMCSKYWERVTFVIPVISHYRISSLSRLVHIKNCYMPKHKMFASRSLPGGLSLRSRLFHVSWDQSRDGQFDLHFIPVSSGESSWDACHGKVLVGAKNAIHLISIHLTSSRLILPLTPLSVDANILNNSTTANRSTRTENPQLVWLYGFLCWESRRFTCMPSTTKCKHVSKCHVASSGALMSCFWGSTDFASKVAEGVLVLKNVVCIQAKKNVQIMFATVPCLSCTRIISQEHTPKQPLVKGCFESILECAVSSLAYRYTLQGRMHQKSVSQYKTPWNTCCGIHLSPPVHSQFYKASAALFNLRSSCQKGWSCW